MKTWLATYGNAYNEYPNLFRSGDTFYLPQIELSHKGDLIYIYFSDYKIDQICFKCRVIETDLFEHQVSRPNGIYEGFWCCVKVLSIMPIGTELLSNSILKEFGLEIVKISLNNFGHLFIHACDISSNKICNYLEGQFQNCFSLENEILLRRQLSKVDLRVKKDDSGEFVFTRYSITNRHQFSPMSKVEWLGELTLNGFSPGVGGHFGPYKGNIREMSFNFLFNSCPDGMFSCEIWESVNNQFEKRIISWHGPQFQFYSLNQILPLCIWLTNLNLQNLSIEDIKNLAQVKLNVEVVNREIYLDIVEQVYYSYNRSFNKLTSKTREIIINWFCEQLRKYPLSSDSEPFIIKCLKYIIQVQ